MKRAVITSKVVHNVKSPPVVVQANKLSVADLAGDAEREHDDGADDVPLLYTPFHREPRGGPHEHVEVAHSGDDG